MKKIYKIITIIIVLLLSLLFSCSFFTRSKNIQLNTINVYLNNSKIKISTILDNGTYIVSGTLYVPRTLYVPIDEISYYFKCEYKKDDEKKIINFIKSQTLKEKPESIDGKSNIKKRDIKIEKSDYQTMIDGLVLFITPIVYDNTFYMPLEQFAESFEKSVKWNLFKSSLTVEDYPEEYAGSINGEKIKKRFFNERYISKSTRLTAGDVEKDKKGKQGKKEITKEQKIKLEEEVFNEIAEMMIAKQKAPQYGAVDEKEIKNRINYYLSMTVGRYGGIAGFRDTFGKNGVTYQDAINYFTYGVIKEVLMEKIAANAEPPEEMMKTYYDNSPKTFIKHAKAIVKHIILPAKDKDEKSYGNEKVEEQKKLANMILEKIRNGEEFEALRQKYSEDYYSDTNMKNHPNGFEVIEGYLSIAKVFEDAVFKLNPGETSGVVKTYRGFHIIKLISKTEEKQKTFEESKERIKSDLAYTAKINYMGELMEKWKKESVIEKQL